MWGGVAAVAPCGDHSLDAGSDDLLADGIGIIAAVGEERFEAVTDHPEELRKALNVVSLAGRQHEAEWEASGVASGVEFGGEASPRSAEPLCLLSPLFKPTAQLCARTTVLSIMSAAVSRPASSASVSSMAANTPVVTHLR